MIEVTTEDGEEIEISIEDAQRRFRARAFSQKGLSTTMNNTTTAAEQITGIAAAEQLDRRRQLDSSIAKAKREIGTALRNQTAYWQTEVEVKSWERQVNDLKRRIANLKSKLEMEGVKPETLEIISRKTLFDRARNYQAQVNRARSNDTTRLTALKTNFLAIEIGVFPGAEEFGEIAGLAEATALARADVIKAVDQALKAMSTLSDAYIISLERFAIRDEAYAAELETATAAQSVYKSLLQEIANLGEQLKNAEAALFEAREVRDSQKDAKAAFEKARDEMEHLHEEKYRVLAEAANRVETHSSKMLKAKGKRDPMPHEYIDAVAALLAGSRAHDVDAKAADWVRELCRHDASATWKDIRAKLTSVYAKKISAGSPSEPSDEVIKTIRAIIFPASPLTAPQCLRVYQNLDDDRLSAIWAASPNDYIVLTYVDQGRDIDFAKASPGQQASALLELLLKQSAGTLIIDQPEDDLDNRIIMQIVALIRKSKDRRQLVFTTHNPNVVVNGDADKVIALSSGEASQGSSARIAIDIDGAIETPAIRTSITRVMEGGKEAFDLRSRKYNFDTIPNSDVAP